MVKLECADWFAERKVCGKDPVAIPLTVLLQLNHLFIQNLNLSNVVRGGGLGTLVLTIHILQVGGSSCVPSSVHQEVGCISTVLFCFLRIIVVHVDEPL